jgi:hypothetical protein
MKLMSTILLSGAIAFGAAAAMAQDNAAQPAGPAAGPRGGPPGGAPGGPGGRAGPGGRGAPGAAGAQAPRAPPSEGGTVGFVDSVSDAGFVVVMSSGQKATVQLGAATTYRKGNGAATKAAIIPGQPIMILGIIQDIQGERKTVIDANQVIAQPVGIKITPPAPGADGSIQRPAGAAGAPGAPGAAGGAGGRAEAKAVGTPPSFYKEGEGTIVATAEANKAIVPALTAWPTGVINRVVKLSDGSYEVHHVGVNWPHHIFVGADFKYYAAN